MFGLSRNRVVIVLILVLLIVSSAASRPRKMQKLATGTWSGPNVRIQVESGSAKIDYSCANGTIEGPLTFDSKGRFTWRGRYYREGPGPVRVSDEGGVAAVYTGSVKDGTMTLTVKLSDSKEVGDTFTLKRGSAGRVFKCK